MSAMKSKRTLAVAVGVIGVITAGSATAATASIPQRQATLTFCASGNYKAFAVAPQMADVVTRVVSPGKCTSVKFTPWTTHLKVYGFYNKSPHAKFYVGKTLIEPNDDVIKVRAAGTTTRHSLRVLGSTVR